MKKSKSWEPFWSYQLTIIQPNSRNYGWIGSHNFLHTFTMALYHKWDVKNGFAYVLQFFSLISNGLGGVGTLVLNIFLFVKMFHWVESKILSIFHNDVSLQMLKNSIVFYSTISPNSVLSVNHYFLFLWNVYVLHNCITSDWIRLQSLNSFNKF